MWIELTIDIVKIIKLHVLLQLITAIILIVIRIIQILTTIPRRSVISGISRVFPYICGNDVTLG